jgi:very-short-patch-repair endonuclease
VRGDLNEGQHYSSKGKENDKKRKGDIKGMGLRVTRFSDKKVFNNTQGALEKIWMYL